MSYLFSDGKYELFKEKATWEDAFIKCRKNNMRLATISTLEEYNLAKQLIYKSWLVYIFMPKENMCISYYMRFQFRVGR